MKSHSKIMSPKKPFAPNNLGAKGFVLIRARAAR